MASLLLDEFNFVSLDAEGHSASSPLRHVLRKDLEQWSKHRRQTEEQEERMALILKRVFSFSQRESRKSFRSILKQRKAV